MMLFDSRTRRPGAATYPPRPRSPATDNEFDIDQFTKPVDQWIGRHPAICLGMALAAGVAIGCLVKRR